MLVKTHRDGPNRTGLDIGDDNVRRFFRKRPKSIELRLDDLYIQCALAPDFWRGRALIHDPRLSEWLQFKAGRDHGARDAMLLTMSPAGPGSFTIKPAGNSKYQAFGAEVTVARKSPPKSYVSATPEFELATQSVA